MSYLRETIRDIRDEMYPQISTFSNSSQTIAYTISCDKEKFKRKTYDLTPFEDHKLILEAAVKFMRTVYSRLFDLSTELSSFYVSDYDKVSPAIREDMLSALSKVKEYSSFKFEYNRELHEYSQCDFVLIHSHLIDFLDIILALPVTDNEIDNHYICECLETILISYQTFIRRYIFLLEDMELTILTDLSNV